MKISVLLAAMVYALPSTASAQIAIAAVSDSAAFTPGLPAVGSLASIGLFGLTGIKEIQVADESPLPYTLEGVSVQVNGAPAPILAVADLGLYQQINIQVPDYTVQSIRTLEVSQSGQTAQFNIDFYSSHAYGAGSWGVLFADSSGYAIVQHADYSLVTPQHPAQPGEIVIAYATNLADFGSVNNAPPIGSPAEAQPLPSLNSEGGYELPFVKVNGQDVEMFYAGLTPGSVGIFQMNFRVPANLPGGDATLSVENVPACYGEGGLCPPIRISTTAKLAVQVPTP